MDLALAFLMSFGLTIGERRAQRSHHTCKLACRRNKKIFATKDIFLGAAEMPQEVPTMLERDMVEGEAIGWHNDHFEWIP
jgi:hypothetical protein